MMLHCRKKSLFIETTVRYDTVSVQFDVRFFYPRMMVLVSEIKFNYSLFTT